ncbi:ATP-binding protein [Massilia sp. LXY-6]|uniref:hybrid sensor histidine kinase/response regulator n=1 Tax=Massilia sp. LXY-6 TaxID=3379823 RepID=UPI003EE0813B
MHVRRGRTLPLRHLLILLTAIGLLPLALLGIWSIHVSSEYRQREQERALLDLARALSSAVDAELDSSVVALSSMAHSPAMAAGDLRAFYEVARVQSQAQPHWLGVFLADGDGKILFRTTAPFGAPAGEPADPASLQQALSLHRPVVGGIARGQGGRAAVPVRIPVTDSHGRTYVLSAVVKPDRILRVIERQRAPSDSLLAVIDASGHIVARSKNQERFVAQPITPALRSLMRTGLEGAGPTNTKEGDLVATAYSSMSRHHWTVVANAPAVTLRAGFFEGIAAYAAGIALSLAVCIGLAYWLSGRIVRAFNVLRRAAAALGAGRPLSVPPSRIRELGGMARALEAAGRQRARHEAERSRLLASLEDALEQARKAGQAKDEFLAVLGHELRNPLSPIVASLDLMDMRDEPGARRERAIMRRQVTHLKRLVDDLLDVSRITSGKLRLELRPLNLAETVRHVVVALPGQAILLDAPDAVWIDGDDSRLAQVLNNLLSNAARFGSTATRVKLAADAEAGLATLSVEDNGIGMDTGLLSRVFEPFFQAPQQLARRTGGLGLGLAIVRKIVELHGGSVGAHSSGPGQGSRFEVVLPLAAPPGQAAEAAPAPVQAPRQVLLVDDNEDAAAGTATLLRHLGHAVEVAYDGAQALASARMRVPEVAILDIGLPDMDGYALAAALRREHGNALRVIALSGYGQQADIERAAQAGFDLHLTKPATLADLMRALAPTPAPAPAATTRRPVT